jgi:alkane 1-monooxygenase
MGIRAFKYYSPLILYVGAWRAFTSHGWICYSNVIYGFVMIPLLELFLRPSDKNFTAAEEEIAKADRVYDYILYFVVLMQLPTLYFFLYSMQDTSLTWVDKLGRIGSMGIMCGTLGLNVGHELGHRVKPFEQRLAKISLMTSLYVHFFVEHNK